MTDPSDETLMLAVRRGDLDALDRLFGRHHRRLHGFLVRLAGDRDHADDLVQETFLRVLRFRGSWRDDGRFVPWLFRIARNLAADGRVPRRAEEPLPDEEFLPEDWTPALDELIRREDHRQLERALAALGERDRELLLLRGVERMSHRDVAEVMGCTEGAARVRVHRALQALKRAWHAQAGVPDGR